MIYAKLAAALALLGAFAWGTIADYHAGKKAGQDAIQAAWDKDKAAIQAVADAAIATATKERDDALEANQVIHDQYEAQVASITANSADFAKRLRNAQAIIAAGSRPVPAGNSGQSGVSSSGPTSAEQLGQLVTLTANLRAECLKNDAALDSLYASINKQPHIVQ